MQICLPLGMSVWGLEAGGGRFVEDDAVEPWDEVGFEDVVKLG